MYLAENDQAFPPVCGWDDALCGYVKDEQIFFCPALGRAPGYYAFNSSLAGSRLGNMDDPSSVVALFESDRGKSLAGGPELLPNEPRHRLGDYYVVASGSVRYIGRKRLPDGTWSKEPEADWVIWEPVLKGSDVGETGTSSRHSASE